MNKIAILNDKLRQNIFNSGKDRVILTQGVSNLPFDEQLRILLKVKLFNNFNSGNDPYSEHDFGMIEHSELKYFFKIDYYDNSFGFALKLGSGQFVPGFEEQLIGAKAGETREINITFPTDYVAELAGQDVVFKVTVNEIVKE